MTVIIGERTRTPDPWRSLIAPEMRNDGTGLKTCGRQRMADMVDPLNRGVTHPLMLEIPEMFLDSRTITDQVQDRVDMVHIQDTKHSLSWTKSQISILSTRSGILEYMELNFSFLFKRFWYQTWRFKHAQMCFHFVLFTLARGYSAVLCIPRIRTGYFQDCCIDTSHAPFLTFLFWASTDCHWSRLNGLYCLGSSGSKTEKRKNKN